MSFESSGIDMTAQNANWLESICSDASAARNLPTFFLTQQRIAQEFLLQKGWPTFAEEDWKYTSLKALQKSHFARQEVEQLKLADAHKFAALESYCNQRIEVLNGKIALPENIETPDFEISKLSSASKDLVVRLTAECSKASKDINFNEALAWASAEDALCIWVKPTATTLRLNINNSVSSSQLLSSPVIFVVVEATAECEIIETYSCSEASQALTAASFHSFVCEQANLKHLRILAEDKSASHLSSNETFISTAATYSSLVLNLGNQLVRNNLTCRLIGENAQANLLGANVLNDKQHVDNHTVLDHVAPHCNSLEIYKGVYGDSAKGIFDGTIIVRQQAQKTNAIQSSRALLLSEDASSFSKPQLKIWADDVKCTHGAAVGQLDEQSIFYLRSRGIPEADARKMLTKAFVAETVENYTNNELNEVLFEILNARLHELLNI